MTITSNSLAVILMIVCATCFGLNSAPQSLLHSSRGSFSERFTRWIHDSPIISEETETQIAVANFASCSLASAIVQLSPVTSNNILTDRVLHELKFMLVMFSVAATHQLELNRFRKCHANILKFGAFNIAFGILYKALLVMLHFRAEILVYDEIITLSVLSLLAFLDLILLFLDNHK